ncbi:hypothetical protein CVT24_013327 [Panaeolus cyanescens]|uniref:LYC1 C-terminal domain-containing protein n=1 Tax=Panaeolus cyanescens TaxID=181874 RepID=A0A409WD59_9AGAR|nr:hypothetical protein CVT24_013327 [Panaeolus cyanescens]
MMRLLHWVLAPQSSLPKDFPDEWGTPPPRYDDRVGDAAFSILYSDIGPEFYQRTGTLPGRNDGWLAQRASTTVWDISSLEKGACLDATSTETSWRWFTNQDMDNIWELDTQQMKADLSVYPFTETEDAAFAMHPGNGVADYQIQRLEVYWTKVQPPLLYWGLVHSPSKDADQSPLTTFAAWTVEYRPPTANTLTITRLRATEATFKSLMSRVISYAAQHGISKVVIWNLDQSLSNLASEMGAQTFDRTENLPSFKWYGAERGSRVTWAFNEK